MSQADFFGSFEVKNSELKVLACFLHECAVNTAKEQSGGVTTGLDVNALNRQAQYIGAARHRMTALEERPYPDLPQSHPTTITCDISFAPEMIRNAQGLVLNGDLLSVVEMWQRLAFELAHSNSAGLAGSLQAHDARRLRSGLESLEHMVLTFDHAKIGVDFPETAEPSATVGGGPDLG